jgi:hypothetical protein
MSGGGLRKKGDYHSTWILGGGFSWIWGICWREFELGSRGKDQYRGHQFAGGFGHGGQDILMVSWS